MLKIQIIRSVREDPCNQSGIGYYFDYLEDNLREKVDVDAISFDLDRNQGIRQVVINNIISPIVKIIKGRKDTDVVHAGAEHCALFFPFARAKRVVTFHHVTNKEDMNTTAWNLVWHISVMISKMFADEFVAISQQTKDEMVEKLKIPAEKITVAMHPPKSEMFLDNVQKEDIVIFVGLLIERKNPKAALHVFKKMIERAEFSGYKLIICGAGPLREEIEDLILEMNLVGKVEIVSNLSVDEMRRLYCKSRFLLNTSKFEGLGITTLEAQMCGTPVLYFEEAKMPPEVMVAAIQCADVEDMVKKAIVLHSDCSRMAEVIDFGIEYSTGFGKDYIEKMMAIYSKK